MFNSCCQLLVLGRWNCNYIHVTCAHCAAQLSILFHKLLEIEWSFKWFFPAPSFLTKSKKQRTGLGIGTCDRHTGSKTCVYSRACVRAHLFRGPASSVEHPRAIRHSNCSFIKNFKVTSNQVERAQPILLISLFLVNELSFSSVNIL